MLMAVGAIALLVIAVLLPDSQRSGITSGDRQSTEVRCDGQCRNYPNCRRHGATTVTQQEEEEER